MNDTELKALATVLGDGFGHAISSRQLFIVRDSTTIAHGRWAVLPEVKFVASEARWGVKVHFRD